MAVQFDLDGPILVGRNEHVGRHDELAREGRLGDPLQVSLAVLVTVDQIDGYRCGLGHARSGAATAPATWGAASRRFSAAAAGCSRATGRRFGRSALRAATTASRAASTTATATATGGRN